MRLLVVSGPAALIVLGTAAFLSGQTPVKPGQIASLSESPAPFSYPASGTSSSAVRRETSIANVEDKHDRNIHRLWVASIFAMAAATSFDAASSWGKDESNSLLASSNGRFGARGVVLKAGIGAAVLVPEILLRKHKEMLTMFAVGNFAEAAVFGAIAVHNLGVAAPPN